MMTDPEIYMFWMAFIGLSVSFLAAAGLMADARVKSQRAARIARACGTAPAPEARRGGPLHERIGRALLRMAAQSGERVSAILGGEARATAEDLQAAGFRGRDAVLIYAFAGHRAGDLQGRGYRGRRDPQEAAGADPHGCR